MEQDTPRSIDPIQQTVATAIQGYLNHPDVDRKSAISAIPFLNQPMLKVQIRDLQRAFKEFQAKGEIAILTTAVEALREALGGEQAVNDNQPKSANSISDLLETLFPVKVRDASGLYLMVEGTIPPIPLQFTNRQVRARVRRRWRQFESWFDLGRFQSQLPLEARRDSVIEAFNVPEFLRSFNGRKLVETS